MNIEVELPDLGPEGGDQATVVEWRFEEGEEVEEGDILIEVMSDGGNMEVPSPCDGVVAEQLVEEGEIVRIGEPLVIIDSPEEADQLIPDDD